MGGGGGETTTTAAANSNSKPKKPPINPNWAQLQQRLQSGRPKLSPDSVFKPPSTPMLGKRKEGPSPSPDTDSHAPPSSVLIPTSTDCSLTDALGMDCEMVGVTSQGNKSALGRVTVVNSWGNVVYDEFVRPLDRVVDFRTHVSGIHPRNLRKAKDFMLVQKEVAELIKGRILVGHALHNDLKVLLLSHPRKDTRDTSEYQPLMKESRRRALKDLAAEVLGVKIQQKEHCPIQDARAAMLIYKKYQRKWEKNIKDQLKFKKKLNGKNNKKKKKKKPAEKGPAESDAPAPVQ